MHIQFFVYMKCNYAVQLYYYLLFFIIYYVNSLDIFRTIFTSKFFFVI